MNDETPSPQPPQTQPQKAKGPARMGAPSREDRLKAALKANMVRRKAQARARAAGDNDSSETDKE